jgi:hypothetical protein
VGLLVTWEQFVAECIPGAPTVQVQQLTGSGAYGNTYAAAVDLGPCYIEDTRRAVVVQTVDAYGEEKLSSTTVWAPLDPEVIPGSLLTIPWRTGRPARVIAAARFTDPTSAGLPAHQELSLE